MNKERDIQHDRERFEQVIQSPTWSDYAEFVNEALPYYMTAVKIPNGVYAMLWSY